MRHIAAMSAAALILFLAVALPGEDEGIKPVGGGSSSGSGAAGVGAHRGSPREQPPDASQGSVITPPDGDGDSPGATQMLRNPRFDVLGETDLMPDGWLLVEPQDEVRIELSPDGRLRLTTAGPRRVLEQTVPIAHDDTAVHFLLIASTEAEGIPALVSLEQFDASDRQCADTVVLPCSGQDGPALRAVSLSPACTSMLVSLEIGGAGSVIAREIGLLRVHTQQSGE